LKLIFFDLLNFFIFRIILNTFNVQLIQLNLFRCLPPFIGRIFLFQSYLWIFLKILFHQKVFLLFKNDNYPYLKALFFSIFQHLRPFFCNIQPHMLYFVFTLQSTAIKVIIINVPLLFFELNKNLKENFSRYPFNK